MDPSPQCIGSDKNIIPTKGVVLRISISSKEIVMGEFWALVLISCFYHLIDNDYDPIRFHLDGFKRPSKIALEQFFLTHQFCYFYLLDLRDISSTESPWELLFFLGESYFCTLIEQDGLQFFRDRKALAGILAREQMFQGERSKGAGEILCIGHVPISLRSWFTCRPSFGLYRLWYCI